jgi:ubiquitin carboxyl-terminal hydrolase 8
MADTSGGAGAGGRPSSSGPGKRILPHIDDITSVTVDIDMYTPIETAVIKAEAALRQAESSRSFGRPDHALAEYLKGSEIVLDIIPKNKGWVSLQRDTKSLAQRYNLLLRRLRDMHPEFEAIKEQIKADNARTGVRPKSAEKGPAKPPLGSNPNGTKMGENGVPGHKHSHSLGGKPAVHPKPANLQGKSLATNADTNDLLARFSRLRTTTQQQQQQQSASKPIPDLLSDLLPNPSPSTTALSTPIPGTQMPRMPAAIYNPPRGSISSEAAALPSSTPRSMFSRTSSTASLNGGRTVQPPSYQSIPAQNPTPTTVAAKRPKPPIPEGDTISVDDLIRLMKVGARDFSILLIDIRSREEFDDGHIMSQATICVEPEVLSRPNISANELAEAMVLAPSAEQVLFEKRHAFDLVVFYDQSSDRITDKPHDMEAKAVSGLFYALSDYDFPGPGVRKCQPKLLRGGLDAWTRVMGPSSLQSSSTSPRQKHADPPIAQAFIKNPRQRYVMKPIQDPAEAKRWEETLADAKSIEPVRSTDEFLRRFPPISNTRESMTSPVNVPRSRPQNSFHQRVLSEESLYTSLPPPPAPPPPAVPRRSYSGLAESDDSAVVAKRVGAQFGGEPTRRYRTGLTNPGVWCFANSSLQAMFAAPGFSREVRSGAWREVYKVPQKPDEKMENPQLLTRFLENLFTWLNQGSLEAITAKSFMVCHSYRAWSLFRS